LNRFDALISKIILKKYKNYFNTFQHKKHFEKQQQPQPHSYIDKISNSTSIKNITAGQANFFLKPISCLILYPPLSLSLSLSLSIKTEKRKELDLIFFFFGGGGNCPHLPQRGSATDFKSLL